MCPFNVMPERSSKLKELCFCLKKENVPFYSNQWDSVSHKRYRYEVRLNRYSNPVAFPYTSDKSGFTTVVETGIFDELAHESVEFPVSGSVVLRIKGNRGGSAKQGWIRWGHIELSDINRVDVMRHAPDCPDVVVMGYLDVEETLEAIIKKGKASGI